MKTDKLRKSSNVEDRRTASGSGYGGGSYRGGGSYGSSAGLGLLLRLLFSGRGRGKWLMIIILGLVLFGGGNLGGLGNILTGGTNNSYTTNEIEQVNTSASDQASDAEFEFLSKVLGSTEDFWAQQFASELNRTYQPPKLTIYNGVIQTACGYGQASTGPFYCPADEKVYIDLSFYRELTTRYNATGDFAMAYVLAHEVGHHVQKELGIMDDYTRRIAQMSQTNANKQTVRLELQADYFAGAWAHYANQQNLLEAGDFEEAMNAAHAVGDDTLQEQAYGRVMPDSFTHGTSQQRRAWFQRGYEYGDIAHGDTFNSAID